MCDAEENEPLSSLRKLKKSSHYTNKSQALRNETLLPLMLTLYKIVTYSCKLAGLRARFCSAMRRNTVFG